MPTSRRRSLAIIVPVWIEPEIESRLDRLCTLSPDELIVVDGGHGATAQSLRDWRAARSPDVDVRVIDAPRGRASQMNAGAKAARSEVLLFLHADTVPPKNAPALIDAAVSDGAIWGRFDVRLSGTHPAFRLIEWSMNARSALTGIATGDQALFVRRDAFMLLRGYAPIPLMEDIELCARLKWLDRPRRLRARVVTSSRRWEQHGIARTVLRMWILRGLYALGVSPPRLARWYK